MASMKSWTLCLFTALLLADGARIKRRRGTTVCPVNGGGCHCNCQAAAAAAMPFGQMPGMPGAMPGAMPGFGPMALTAPVVTPPQAPPQSPPPPPPPPPPPQPPLPPPEPPVALPALPKVPELSSEDLPTLGPPPPPTLPPTAAPLAQLVMPTMPPPQLPNPFAGSHNPLSAIPNPMAGIPNPMAGMQNPMAGMQNPMAGMPNPMAGMPNPMSGMPNPMAMGGQSPFGQAGAFNMPGVPGMPGMPGMPAGAPAPAGTPGVAGQAVTPQAMLAQAAATLPGMHQPPGASAQGLNSLASMVQQRAQGELTYHYYQYVPGYGYVYEPGLKTDGQNLAALIKNGRKTTKTCGCLQSWSHKGQSCNSYCCNPDNDAAGPWCFVMDQACQGDTWGTCEALAAAAPGPSPAASPASPAPAPAPVAAAAKMLAQMTSNTTEASATDEAAVEELAAVLSSDEVKEEPKRNLRASFMQRKQGLEQVEGSPCDCGGD